MMKAKNQNMTKMVSFARFGANFAFDYALNNQMITVIAWLCLHTVLKRPCVTLMTHTVDLNA